MDPRTGEIHHIDPEIFEREFTRLDGNSERLVDQERKLVSLSEDEAEELQKHPRKFRKGWMRNQPCVCGSGKKFKKCCWSKFQ